jgi:hypothetical protein
MNRRSSVVVIAACVAFLVFLAGWIAATVVQDGKPAEVRTVTVTVTPEPSAEPSPSVTPTPAPVVRQVTPAPKPTNHDNHDSDDSDHDDADSDSLKDEAREFNKNPDGYKPDDDCDAECQFKIADYGDD